MKRFEKIAFLMDHQGEFDLVYIAQLFGVSRKTAMNICSKHGYDYVKEWKTRTCVVCGTVFKYLQDVGYRRRCGECADKHAAIVVLRQQAAEKPVVDYDALRVQPDAKCKVLECRNGVEVLSNMLGRRMRGREAV